MSLISPKPRGGIYGNDLVYNAYVNLQEELERFVPEHLVGKEIAGTGAKMIAKAKIIENLAKNLVEATKAVGSK